MGLYWKLCKEKKEEKKLDANSRFLLLLALALIVVGFGAPFIFTDKNSTLDFVGSGEIGDTMGGLMSPFINVAAVIVTGLAFYMQYQANKIQIDAFKTQKEQFDKEQKSQIEALEEQKRQFEEEREEQRKNVKLQKFEAQFYEMLRLHKENVNEIEIEDINGKIIRGRNVFFEMKKELDYLFNLLNVHSDNLDEDILKIIYEKFFWGYTEEYESIEIGFAKTNNKEWPEKIEIKDDNKETRFLKTLKKNRAKSYNEVNILKGYHSYLGHYYRHLFYIVKFVVYQREDLILESKKIEYLKILRNQLSNYEQEMLFYNWLSGYGKNWENEENSFFTKYKMIHNLWYSNLYGDDFIKEKLKGLVKKYKEQGGQGDLFEIKYKIDEKFS